MSGRDALEMILVLVVIAFVAALTSGGHPDRPLPDFDYRGFSERHVEWRG